MSPVDDLKTVSFTIESDGLLHRIHHVFSLLLMSWQFITGRHISFISQSEGVLVRVRGDDGMLNFAHSLLMARTAVIHIFLGRSFFCLIADVDFFGGKAPHDNDLEYGPVSGTYRDAPMHEWVIYNKRRYRCIGLCSFDLSGGIPISSLKDGQIIVGNGLLYQIEDVSGNV